MEASNELLVIAELGIGLAGFSGVVVAFRRSGGLRRPERFLFIALVTAALCVAFLAFVPFGFHYAGQAGATLWMGSSAVMASVWLGVMFSLFPSIPAEMWSTPPLGKAGAALSTGLPVLIPFFQIANVVGWPMESGPLFYLVGLVLWLLNASMTFVSLVLSGDRE